MAEFGEDLRRERESRGVSLGDLQAETKVGAHHFEALERGDFHQLPGGVFRRGILKSYLQALQLNEEDWLPRYEASAAEHAHRLGLKEIAQQEAWVAFASNVKRNRARTRRPTWGRWLGVAAGALILAVAAWLVYSMQIASLLK
jgi:cytoskeletal protein RodZ